MGGSPGGGTGAPSGGVNATREAIARRQMALTGDQAGTTLTNSPLEDTTGLDGAVGSTSAEFSSPLVETSSGFSPLIPPGGELLPAGIPGGVERLGTSPNVGDAVHGLQSSIAQRLAQIDRERNKKKFASPLPSPPPLLDVLRGRFGF